MIPMDALDTPAVTIDLDIMEANIRKMQAYCDDHGIRFRPHVKTHKIPEVAALQRAAGAGGITCQKLGEAEVFADAGFDDILVSYNLMGPVKLQRLTDLARRIRIGTTADSTPVVQGIAEAARAAGVEIPLLVECDTGAGRTGVQTPQQALELAQLIEGSAGVRFEGLMTFPTNLECTPGFLTETLALLERAGIEARTVSGGGTPQSWTVHQVPQINEHRAGTYVYNDANTLAAGTCTLEECAMRVLMTVVSRPVANRAILDGGSKTLSVDRLLWKEPSFGLIVEYPQAVIYGFSEEHANVDLSRCDTKPRVGERVSVIPNHCCMVSNLHDQVTAIRGGEVERVWDVKARGRVR